MELYNVTIPPENVEAALSAINGLKKNPDIPKPIADNIPEDDFESLTEAFRHYGYEAVEDNDHCIIEYYNGGDLWNDDVLWKALEAHILPKAEIYCYGEDHETWKWVFRNGKFKELTGRVVYEDPEEDLDDDFHKRKNLIEKDITNICNQVILEKKSNSKTRED